MTTTYHIGYSFPHPVGWLSDYENFTPNMQLYATDIEDIRIDHEVSRNIIATCKGHTVQWNYKRNIPCWSYTDRNVGIYAIGPQPGNGISIRIVRYQESFSTTQLTQQENPTP